MPQNPGQVSLQMGVHLTRFVEASFRLGRLGAHVQHRVF